MKIRQDHENLRRQNFEAIWYIAIIMSLVFHDQECFKQPIKQLRGVILKLNKHFNGFLIEYQVIKDFFEYDQEIKVKYH